MPRPTSVGPGLEGTDALTWLSRFTICLQHEVHDSLGSDWESAIDAGAQTIQARRDLDDAHITVSLHPGMHVVNPLWAAHRIADQMQLAAVARGLIPPPMGSVPPKTWPTIRGISGA